MNVDQLYHDLLVPNDSKLALVVLDGLGDIAAESTGFRIEVAGGNSHELAAIPV